MKWTVITLVEKSELNPPPKDKLQVNVVEVGCLKCVVGHDAKLKPCWEHNRSRILWAVTVEGELEEVNEVEVAV